MRTKGSKNRPKATTKRLIKQLKAAQKLLKTYRL